MIRLGERRHAYFDLGTAGEARPTRTEVDQSCISPEAPLIQAR